MKTLAVALAVGALGCAHIALTPEAGDRIDVPVIIARLADSQARSNVFRADGSYRQQLVPLDAAEGDRRLAEKLTKGSVEGGPSMNRFEITDTLRAQTLAFLPRGHPWSRTVNPVEVARVLESFLIEDAAAGRLDYSRLKELGADTVLEYVVEEYGMRSVNGVAGVYVVGTARLSTLDGALLYQRRFFSDEVKAGFEHLDPFDVAKTPNLFRVRLKRVLTAIAEQIAEDVAPTAQPQLRPPASEAKKSDPL